MPVFVKTAYPMRLHAKTAFRKKKPKKKEETVASILNV
jgi:hypothetical protein